MILSRWVSPCEARKEPEARFTKQVRGGRAATAQGMGRSDHHLQSCKDEEKSITRGLLIGTGEGPNVILELD